MQSDICCLQEVQAEHFPVYIEPFLKSKNYEIIYGKKRDPLPDGSLLAVDRSLFSVVSSEIVQMYHHEYCRTGQIGVVAVLKHKPTGKKLIVATTHLAFNPYRGDWKLKQSIHLIAEITKQIELTGDSSIPVIICGDLNSLPNSIIISYFANRQTELSDIPSQRLSGQTLPKFDYYRKKHGIPGNTLIDSTKLEYCGLSKESKYLDENQSQAIFEDLIDGNANPNNDFILSKSMTLKSAYQNAEKATSCVGNGQSDCVDYIFYSPDILLSGRLEQPDELNELPDDIHGSDHLPLAIDFSFG